MSSDGHISFMYSVFLGLLTAVPFPLASSKELFLFVHFFFLFGAFVKVDCHFSFSLSLSPSPRLILFFFLITVCWLFPFLIKALDSILEPVHRISGSSPPSSLDRLAFVWETTPSAFKCDFFFGLPFHTFNYVSCCKVHHFLFVSHFRFNTCDAQPLSLLFPFIFCSLKLAFGLLHWRLCDLFTA